MVLIIDKGIENSIWGYSADFAVGGIEGFFSIKDISKRLLEIDNKRIRKGFWDCNVDCSVNEIKGSFSIDNINNRFSGVILSGISRLFIVLFDIDIKGIVIKGTLIISIISKDNGSLIVNSIFIENDCI